MIEINNLTQKSVSERFLKKVAKDVLKEEKREGYGLSIALVGPAEIRKLNKEYLEKDEPTDVLSFPQTAEKAAGKNQNLGEIVICIQEVGKNAKRFNSTFEKELSLVLIHGILHLLDYNHKSSTKGDEKMRKKERYYFRKYFPVPSFKS